MASRKTRALTLRITDYSETSQIVTVFSRDFGRLSLLSKGARRKRRGGPAAVDLLQLVEVVFLERPHARLHLLTESRLIEEYAGLRRDLARGYAAFFVAELLVTLTEEHDPDPPVFELARETLRMLAETPRPTVVLHAFEVRLLALIGLLPRLDACAWCGGTLETSGEVAFAPGSGGTVCARCAPQVHEHVTVSRGALAALNKLAASPLNRVERLKIDGTIAKDVRKMLARLWMHILGREPRMLRYLT
ncbi:MAG TPA: DNA repair protein RecO [Planctomycetota bacterium]|nr:DNA repair protein RecO [Planctomycetota bacterium]HUV38157.1 DNA repair protein RecO [Planctomycetota bacterium]